jgi:hypothetical protein
MMLKKKKSKELMAHSRITSHAAQALHVSSRTKIGNSFAGAAAGEHYVNHTEYLCGRDHGNQPGSWYG